MERHEIDRLFASKHLDKPHLQDLKEVCDDIQRVAHKVRDLLDEYTNRTGDALPLCRGIVGIHTLATAKHILLDALGLKKHDRGGFDDAPVETNTVSETTGGVSTAGSVEAPPDNAA